MPREALVYCLHVSHVLNLGDIPARLAAAGWSVRWVNACAQSAFPLPLAEGVQYRFDTPVEAVGGMAADLYLTPYVGQAAHFPQRARRVHFLVSLTSLEGVYDPAMFDHYDAIACAGRHHLREFADLGRRRGWGGNKTLLPVGYPKLDGQRRQLAASGTRPPDGSPPTVVFAPTHAYYVNAAHSVLGAHGPAIVDALVADGIRVVFRPHVESWRDQDRPVVDAIVARHGGNPLFQLDRSGDYFASYAASHLMLTDVSGTGFTYAFTFGRPALFFAPDAVAEEGKRGIQFEYREKIGAVVRGIDGLLPAVRAALEQGDALAARIAAWRDWLLFNPGGSEGAFVAQAETLVAGGTEPGWVRA